MQIPIFYSSQQNLGHKYLTHVTRYVDVHVDELHLRAQRDPLTNVTVPDSVLSVINSTVTPSFF
jgi:hypothetical protein